MHRLELLIAGIVLGTTLGCGSVQSHQDDVQRRVEERAGPAAFAGDPQRLSGSMSIDDVVAVALATNQGLRADLRSLDISWGQLVAAGAVANPELELEGHIPVGDSGGSVGLEGALLQELNSLLARPLMRAVAKQELRRTKAQTVGAILALGARAREAAWDYVASRELLALRQLTLKAADASFEVATRLFQAGNVSRLEVAQRQAAREQARLDLRAAQRMVVASRERLNRLMGLYGDEAGSWELTAGFPAVPEEEKIPLADLEARVVGSSLALEAGRFDLEAQGARGRAAAFNAWPHLAVGVFAEVEAEEGFTAVGPALEVSLPLWSFGRGNLAVAESRLAQAQDRYAQSAVELRADVREAREVLVEAGERARFLRDVLLPLRKEITQQTLLHYNSMHVGVLQLLSARQAETDVTAQWVEAVRDYWVARTRVELLVQGGAAASFPTSMPSPGLRAGGGTPNADEDH